MNDFEYLKSLFQYSNWPSVKRVDNLSFDQEYNRSKILFEKFVSSKKILDFGCGKGFGPKYLSDQGCDCVGFDILEQDEFLSWESSDKNFLLTTSIDKVYSRAPYDLIIFYNVLDYLNNQTHYLNKMSSLLSPGGRMYFRCVPWCGQNLHKDLLEKTNKKFVQLIFTDEEMDLLGLSTKTHINKYIRPHAEYNSIFTSCNLVVASSFWGTSEVDLFFKDEIIYKRIKSTLSISQNEAFPPVQMKINYVDFYCEKFL